MYEWIPDVFDTNSEKAKFITVLISVASALFIFRLNQYFTDRRAKKTLLIEKIEELYKLAIEYEDNCLELLDDTIKQLSVSAPLNVIANQKMIRQINNKIYGMELVLSLHFKEHHIYFDDFKISNTIPYIETAVKNKTIDKTRHIKEIEKSGENIENNVKFIKNTCSKLISKHTK